MIIARDAVFSEVFIERRLESALFLGVLEKGQQVAACRRSRARLQISVSALNPLRIALNFIFILAIPVSFQKFYGSTLRHGVPLSREILRFATHRLISLIPLMKIIIAALMAMAIIGDSMWNTVLCTGDVMRHVTSEMWRDSRVYPEMAKPDNAEVADFSPGNVYSTLQFPQLLICPCWRKLSSGIFSSPSLESCYSTHSSNKKNMKPFKNHASGCSLNHPVESMRSVSASEIVRCQRTVEVICHLCYQCTHLPLMNGGHFIS